MLSYFGLTEIIIVCQVNDEIRPGLSPLRVQQSPCNMIQEGIGERLGPLLLTAVASWIANYSPSAQVVF